MRQSMNRSPFVEGMLAGLRNPEDRAYVMAMLRRYEGERPLIRFGDVARQRREAARALAASGCSKRDAVEVLRERFEIGRSTAYKLLREASNETI